MSFPVVVVSFPVVVVSFPVVVVSFPVVVVWTRWRSSTSVTWHLRPVFCGCQ
jgi:hypothetical protein